MRRRGDFNTNRFWRWFAAEADGLANGIEALARGEADAEWLLIGVNERVRAYDPDLVADLRKTPYSACELVIRGHDPRSAVALVLAAPRLPGWSFTTAAATETAPRVPFRLAPRPSLDISTITARHDAYAAKALA